MISKLPGEVWKPIRFPGWKQLRYNYAVSNVGRIASYKEKILEGKHLSGSLTTGYRTLNLHRPGNKGTLYIHREIAKNFLKKPTPKHRYVIHVNHDKLDNNYKNLCWCTLEQMISHQQKSPAKIAYKSLQANRTVGLKLNMDHVKKIKLILKDPQRTITIKRLAKKYRVSEMTIYRIKSGENWARV
jgi:hypothetical protein